MSSPSRGLRALPGSKKRLGADTPKALTGEVLSIVDLRYKPPESNISTWFFKLAEDPPRLS